LLPRFLFRKVTKTFVVFSSLVVYSPNPNKSKKERISGNDWNVKMIQNVHSSTKKQNQQHKLKKRIILLGWVQQRQDRWYQSLRPEDNHME
jgi:hypothetical protein